MKILKKNKVLFFTVAWVIASISGIVFASAYKWTDANGEVHFSQTPPPGVDSTQISIPTQNTTSVPKQTEAERLEAIYQKNEDKNAALSTEEKIKLQNEQAKKTNCDRARDHLEDILSKPRVRLTDPQGNTIQLTDEERNAEIEKTQKVIKDSCVGGK